MCSSDLAEKQVDIIENLRKKPSQTDAEFAGIKLNAFNSLRSEERRVGKECRSRWSRYH